MPAQAIFPYVPSRRDGSCQTGCSTIRVLNRWFGSWNIQLHRRCHSVEDLTQRYDARARQWDETLASFETADAYRVVLSRALPDEMILDPQATPRVLDCGTGTGAFLSAFADAAGGKPDLHGVDISASMLEQARRNLSARGYSATFQQGEVTDLPYNDDSFDVVLAAHVIEHVPDPRKALSEARRVLKPGGLLVLCVTRDTLMGRAIQLLWRTHSVSLRTAQSWLHATGFRSVRPLRAMSVGRFDAMSLACVARNPEVQADAAIATPSKEADHV